jgi:hypothetical protein
LTGATERYNGARRFTKPKGRLAPLCPKTIRIQQPDLQFAAD